MADFDDIINNYKNMELGLRTSSSRISRARLLVFVVGASLMVYFVRNDHTVGVLLTLAGFIAVFSWLVRRHGRVVESLDRIKCRIRIIGMYKDRLGEEWNNFEDDGVEYIDKNHPYCVDLDLFGPSSLFQWLNNCQTWMGRRFLSNLLLQPNKDLERMTGRQKQIGELGGKFEFCEKLMSEGMLSKKIGRSPEELLAYAEDTDFRFQRRWTINIFLVLPLLTVVSSALAFMKSGMPDWIPYILILLQMGLSGIGYLKFQRIMNSVNNARDSICAYERIINLIVEEKFEDKGLKRLQDVLNNHCAAAGKGLRSLNRITDYIDFRYNPILYFILNMALLWDYHCIFMLEQWKRTYGPHIREWLVCIGELEAFASLSVPIHLGLADTFAEFDGSSVFVDATELGHPLIAKSKRVNNSISIDGNQCIITGSNMSGKTTMLRTIGISLVLAYAGAPVVADRFRCSVMEMFTSMRVSDDLGKGISTFYAELLRIKLLIDYSKEAKPMIYLIDEIFRGTNSVDRITGAKGLVQNMDKPWIIGLITTHDFELCELGSGSDSIVNYHFEESYQNDRIIFDYKLRSGRSNTTNARYLMKMVGLDIDAE